MIFNNQRRITNNGSQTEKSGQQQEAPSADDGGTKQSMADKNKH